MDNGCISTNSKLSLTVPLGKNVKRKNVYIKKKLKYLEIKMGYIVQTSYFYQLTFWFTEVIKLGIWTYPGYWNRLLLFNSMY